MDVNNEYLCCLDNPCSSSRTKIANTIYFFILQPIYNLHLILHCWTAKREAWYCGKESFKFWLDFFQNTKYIFSRYIICSPATNYTFQLDCILYKYTWINRYREWKRRLNFCNLCLHQMLFSLNWWVLLNPILNPIYTVISWCMSRHFPTL